MPCVRAVAVASLVQGYLHCLFQSWFAFCKAGLHPSSLGPPAASNRSNLVAQGIQLFGFILGTFDVLGNFFQELLDAMAFPSLLAIQDLLQGLEVLTQLAVVPFGHCFALSRQRRLCLSQAFFQVGHGSRHRVPGFPGLVQSIFVSLLFGTSGTSSGSSSMMASCLSFAPLPTFSKVIFLTFSKVLATGLSRPLGSAFQLADLMLVQVHGMLIIEAFELFQVRTFPSPPPLAHILVQIAMCSLC